MSDRESSVVGDVAWGEEWDDVADVVVVGAGAAGMAAAFAASARGSSVLVLEKAPAAGGTTAKSSATMWFPNNPLMRRAGLSDPRDDALRYLAKLAYPTMYDPAGPTLGLPGDKYRLLEVFFDHGTVAFEELIAADAIPYNEESVSLGFPDYRADLAEDAAPVGRAIFMKYPPGHRPGRDATGGQLLIEAMIRASARNGAKVLADHRVVHVIRHDDGRVIGVEAQTGRRTVLIGARRAVVFGSGGFLHDRSLRVEFLQGPVFGGAASETSTGDFVRIGIEVGAQLGNMTQAWWSEVALELSLRAPSTLEDVWSPFGDSMIVVNRYGTRVMNEKLPYCQRGPVHFQWDADTGEYRNLLLFMVYDDVVARSDEPFLRYPVPMPGEANAHVISAPDWPSLAGALAQRLETLSPHTGGFRLATTFLDGLRASVDRFNELARRGSDDDHHRGETPIERHWAREPRPGSPSATMFPFAPEGPYHCIILGGGALDTKGGPVIDDHGRVLGVDGQPIVGLYGAGNCIASPAGQAYWGPGGTIGPALTFGHLAGVHAAAEPKHDPEPGLRTRSGRTVE